MIAFLAKYLSLEALKIGLRALITTTIINPQINRLTKQMKIYIDDPETNGDEELELKFNEFLKYKADKLMGKWL